jgi:hypothetical protein
MNGVIFPLLCDEFYYLHLVQVTLSMKKKNNILIVHAEKCVGKLRLPNPNRQTWLDDHFDVRGPIQTDQNR